MSDATEQEQQEIRERRERECDEARRRLEELQRKLESARTTAEQLRERVSALADTKSELDTSYDSVVRLIDESESSFSNANERFQTISEEWHRLESDAGEAKEEYDEETQSVKVVGIVWYFRASEYFDKRDAFRAIEPDLASAREAKEQFRVQLTERKDARDVIASERSSVESSLAEARSASNEADAHVNSIVSKIESAQIRVDANCG